MRRGRGQAIVVVTASLVIAGGLVYAVVRQNATRHAGGSGQGLLVPVRSAIAGPPSPTRYPSSGVPTAPIRTPPRVPQDTGCHAGQGPDRLPEVPAAVSAKVDAAWARIERWLGAHAPATRLGPPADLTRLASAQREIGVPFPAELVASLRRHSGFEQIGSGTFTFPPFYAPSSIDEIARNAKTLCTVLAEPVVDSGVGSWWHGQWLPFAEDGGGNSLFLDQRGHAGRLGEHDNEGSANFDRWPASLTDLLDQTATALETGGPAFGRYPPKVEKGVLDWEIPR
ncbi:SMI1/KNR4 family protein [Amycolatopsis sp. NPDC059027]|uniref:SMI1/KNR4 family protein n=1 Tax=unclassified Amycolatopsis TaxID=2618356 RepID=UPI00366B9240